MIYIAHRGNIDGPNPEKENSLDYINVALEEYDVEIDVWYIDNKFYLGHDEPIYETSFKYLSNKKLWCHAKNLAALDMMLKNRIHCFYHQSDDYVLTSNGYIWAYPNQIVTNSIAVMPELHDTNVTNAIGICSDFIKKYKNNA